MADEKKKVKKGSKKEKEVAADPAPAVAAPPAEAPKRASTKKVKRTGSNILSVFSEKQTADFKEAFNFIDADKDGVISKNDLVATFDAMGRIADDSELESMLREASGPINFTQLLTLFATRMAGAADDEDVVIGAFKSFDDGGKINSEKLRSGLQTFGDKFSDNEIEDIYGEMTIDKQGNIDTGKLIAMLTATAEEEEE